MNASELMTDGRSTTTTTSLMSETVKSIVASVRPGAIDNSLLVTPLSRVISLIQHHHHHNHNLMMVPRTRLHTIGDRASGVAGTRVRNKVPSSVISAPSLAVFKRNLKTHLFRQSYSSH